MVRRLEREERKEGKRPPPAVRKTKPPPDLEYLLDWYNACRAGQERGQYYEPLSHKEIEAFRNLHSLDMDSFDVLTLRRIDAAWQEAQPDPSSSK